MLSRRALCALNAARIRTACRTLGLPVNLAHSVKPFPAILKAAYLNTRSLATTSSLYEPEGPAVDSSPSATPSGSTSQLPPSLLAKIQKYAKSDSDGSKDDSYTSNERNVKGNKSFAGYQDRPVRRNDRNIERSDVKASTSSPPPVFSSKSFIQAASPSNTSSSSAYTSDRVSSTNTSTTSTVSAPISSEGATSPSSSSDDSGPASSDNSESQPADLSSRFVSLKGRIRHEIYQALTSKPFKFEKMSSVQEAVLRLLPELAHPSARGGKKPDVTELATQEDGQALSSPRDNTREVRTDLLVKAKTGTGKTLAFLVPALEARFKDIEEERRRYMEANPNADKAQLSRHMANYTKTSVGTVILSPTRELATQIANEAAKLMYNCKGMGVQLFIGGASKHRQLREFSFGARDIVVATPGRLQDMLESPLVREQVSRAKMLVLDEADTLLDMGFKDSIDQIVSQLPPKEARQTFLFSATVSPDIRKIARRTLKNEHAFIDCVPENESNTHEHIPQYSTVLSSSSEQVEHVYRLLTQDALLHPEGGKAIVFLPTTKMTELFALLIRAMRANMPWGIRGTQVFEMHSKKTQSARDNTAARFRELKGPGYSILVTSDVSARGVDYPGVTRVIQVGIPGSKDTYVHRVGRTGRAGKAGRGDLVLLPFEKGFLQTAMQDLPLQPTVPDELQSDIERLAADIDANPPAPAATSSGQQQHQNRSLGATPRQGRGGFNPQPSPPTLVTPILPRVQKMHNKLKDEIIPELAAVDIHEAFGSQLGFYAAHCHAMRISRSQLYESLQEWAVEALGLAEPPRVSASLLQKLGLGQPKRSGKLHSFGAADGRRRAYEDLRSFRQQDGPRNSFNPYLNRNAERGPPPRRFPANDRTDKRSLFGGNSPVRGQFNDRRDNYYR